MAKQRKTKTKVGVAVRGRSFAYVQEVGKGKKLGKAKPVMITLVNVGSTGAPKKAPKKKRR